MPKTCFSVSLERGCLIPIGLYFNPFIFEWCTRQQNEHHAKINGLKYRPIGIKHPRSKLTEKQVLGIRKLYFNKKYNQYQLADLYNVCVQNINSIVLMKTWSHI